MMSQDANTPNLHSAPPLRSPAWVRMSSELLARMAAGELLTKPSLPSPMREALVKATSLPASEALARIAVWVDLSGLDLYELRRDEQQWRRAALTYLIAREAHLPLLKRLFKATREEIAEIRLEIGADLKPAKPKAIPPAELTRIYSAWRKVQLAYEREADQWVALGELCPKHTMASLYTVIVIEAVSNV